MKQFAGLLLLALTLGAGFSVAQVSEGESWEEDNEFWTDEELTMFETDNWVEDDLGMYDNDFVWETEDDYEFNEWYGGVEEDWAAYDDAGDAGWFDI